MQIVPYCVECLCIFVVFIFISILSLGCLFSSFFIWSEKLKPYSVVHGSQKQFSIHLIVVNFVSGIVYIHIYICIYAITVYIFNLILITHGIYDVFGKKMFINWTADGLGFLCCINCGQFLMSPKDFYFLSALAGSLLRCIAQT